MKRTPTPGPDLDATIGRLRAIVAQAGDALVTEGPVHPDHQLLDLCATALHYLAPAQKSQDARDKKEWMSQHGAAREAAYRADQRLYDAFVEGERLGKPPLFKITRLKATTAAGVYAKALVVRSSRTGAAHLARSLATDLLACPGLRQSLWPAGEEG